MNTKCAQQWISFFSIIPYESEPSQNLNTLHISAASKVDYCIEGKRQHINYRVRFNKVEVTNRNSFLATYITYHYLSPRNCCSQMQPGKFIFVCTWMLMSLSLELPTLSAWPACTWNGWHHCPTLMRKSCNQDMHVNWDKNFCFLSSKVSIGQKTMSIMSLFWMKVKSTAWKPTQRRCRRMAN